MEYAGYLTCYYFQFKTLTGFGTLSGLTGKTLILLINYPHHTHIIATLVDAEGVGLFGGDFHIQF